MEIIPTSQFKRDIEYYENKRGFSHITDDIGKVVVDLTKGNLVGNEIPRTTYK